MPALAWIIVVGVAAAILLLRARDSDDGKSGYSEKDGDEDGGDYRYDLERRDGCGMYDDDGD